MAVLPSGLTQSIVGFSDLFSKRAWPLAQVLLAGAILAVGLRTVAAVLRVMGMAEEKQFQKYHRVLNRVKWSALAASRRLLRSSHSHFVKAIGLRWLCLMLVAPIPWPGRCWVLPFCSVLAPSERYYLDRKRRPNKLTDRARQLLWMVKRWLPERSIVVVADSSFAALNLLPLCANNCAWSPASVLIPPCTIPRQPERRTRVDGCR